MENNRNKSPLKKTKRLDTLKKKARELSVLCDVDVCLVGTHQNPANNLGSSSAKWHTWPEDPRDLARVLDRYKEKVEEKEPEDSGKREILEFDVDKALERMNLEELRLVYDRANEIAGDVDEKLDLLSRKQNSGAQTTPIPMVCSSSMDQTMKEANGDELDSDGASKGIKIFGVLMRPAMESQTQSSSHSPQSTDTEA